MPAIAPPLAISPEDLRTLGQWSRSGSIRAALVERAKILLLAAEGLSNTEIAQQVGCSRPTVILWRHRYTQAGLDGLLDKPRLGRPQTVRADRRAEILAATLTHHPSTWATHWSTRLLGEELGVSHHTVARVWGDHDLKPWRTETFTFATDPQLEAKVADVVGLYLHPPERAIVVGVDEKRQLQTLSRTAPNLPLPPGSPERRTHDSVRHRTTTLLAALAVATGRVTDRRFQRHRHGEFLAFLKLVAKAPRGGSCTWCWTTTAPTPSHGHGLAGPPPKDPPALHPDLSQLEEPPRGGLLDHHRPGDPAGQLPERSRPDRRHPPLGRWLEPALPALWVGQRHRRHHDQSHP